MYYFYFLKNDLYIHIFIMNQHNLYIANQYNIISNEFDNSRVRIWNTVKNFLNSYDINHMNLLDAGCGNGKNMIYANTIGYNTIGFDISNNLLDICKKKNLNVYYSDILNDNIDLKYDKILAIAVLHHLDSIDLQILAIKNLFNSLNENGSLLVSFWSKEKNYNNNNNNILSKNVKDFRNFDIGPNYVDWKLKNNTTIKRFYYIHDKDSINNLANQITNNYIINWELQNWFITFYK